MMRRLSFAMVWATAVAVMLALSAARSEAASLLPSLVPTPEVMQVLSGTQVNQKSNQATGSIPQTPGQKHDALVTALKAKKPILNTRNQIRGDGRLFRQDALELMKREKETIEALTAMDRLEAHTLHRARIGVPSCPSFPFCSRIPMPPPTNQPPADLPLPFMNVPPGSAPDGLTPKAPGGKEAAGETSHSGSSSAEAPGHSAGGADASGGTTPAAAGAGGSAHGAHAGGHHGGGGGGAGPGASPSTMAATAAQTSGAGADKTALAAAQVNAGDQPDPLAF